jgi:hypothetical protein
MTSQDTDERLSENLEVIPRYDVTGQLVGNQLSPNFLWVKPVFTSCVDQDSTTIERLRPVSLGGGRIMGTKENLTNIKSPKSRRH